MRVGFFRRYADAGAAGRGYVRVVDAHVDGVVVRIDQSACLGGVLVNVFHKAVRGVRILVARSVL